MKMIILWTLFQYFEDFLLFSKEQNFVYIILLLLLNRLLQTLLSVPDTKLVNMKRAADK